MPQFFLWTLTSEACLSTPSCTGWLICECLYKVDGRWDINIYIPLLRPAAFCLISLVEASPLYTALMSRLHPGQHLIQAHTVMSVLLEHVPSKNPTWVTSLSQNPCLLPRHPAAWEGSSNCHEKLFDGGALSATCLSEPLQAAYVRLCCVVCSKACFAIGDMC